MNENQRNKLPLLVADMLVGDILDSSDEEILSEAREKYDDVDSEIEKTRNIINAAVIESRKSRLSDAKEELENNKAAKQKTNILSLSISDKRNLINQAKKSVNSLTLAARNEEEMSESDADGILQDLIDLGVIDENGSIK
jgi:hypothetical protein